MVWLSSLSPPIRYLQTAVGSPWSLLLFRLSYFLSLPLCIMCFSPLILVALHWTGSRMSVSVLGSPKLDTASRCSLTNCLMEGKDHFPWPSGRTLASAAQHAVSPFHCKRALLAHTQLVRRVLSCKAALQAGRTQLVLQHGITPCQVRHSASAELPGVPANLALCEDRYDICLFLVTRNFSWHQEREQLCGHVVSYR